MADRKEALSIIYRLIEHCNTWHEVKSEINNKGFSDLLSASDYEDLSEKWQIKVLSSFSEKDLEDEISHWADGGNRNNHLDGFNAVSPKLLIKEAENRGWFVKQMESGIVAITMPKKGLTTLKLPITD